MVLRISPFTVRTPRNHIISFKGDQCTDVSTILVTSEYLEDAAAVALAAFGFGDNLLDSMGYSAENVAESDYIRSYANPSPWAEVSRFTSTVAEEISLGAKYVLSPADLSARLHSVVDLLRIQNLLDKHPLRLSGGETAKTILAAHLMQSPELMVVDRSLGQLDFESRQSFMNSIKSDDMLQGTLLVIIDYYEVVPLVVIDRVWNISNDDVNIMFRTPFSGIIHPLISSSQLSVRLVKSRIDADDVKKVSMFCVKNLSVVRGRERVLGDVSFDARGGSLLWVTGPNGSGKTTLFEALVRHIPTVSGSIMCNNVDISKVSNEFIAYSPQQPDLDITEQNLLKEITFNFRLSKCKEHDDRLTERWLKELQVSESDIHAEVFGTPREKKLGSVLASFARSRAIVLLDEPSLFLSREDIRIIVRAIERHLHNAGIIMIASHDLRLLECVMEQMDIDKYRNEM